MADTRPTPASFIRAVRLCLKVLIQPERMKDEEIKDAQIRLSMGPPPTTQPDRAALVQGAFFSSFFLVLVSGSLGYAAGKMMLHLGRCAEATTTTWLQVTSAAILLWATLFIRGWEIQSFGGVTLEERVNQWLYRAMCFVGTVIGVYSLAFPACRQ
jgi:hypothetical protein